MSRRKALKSRKHAWAPRASVAQSSRVAQLIATNPIPASAAKNAVVVSAPEASKPATSTLPSEGRHTSASVAEFLSRWHARSVRRRASAARRPRDARLQGYFAGVYGLFF